MKVTEGDLARVIQGAFRLGFGNALAEVDADLQSFGHGGRRRRCCAPCSVLAVATAKYQDGRYSMVVAADHGDPRGGRTPSPWR